MHLVHGRSILFVLFILIQSQITLAQPGTSKTIGNCASSGGCLPAVTDFVPAKRASSGTCAPTFICDGDDQTLESCKSKARTKNGGHDYNLYYASADPDGDIHKNATKIFAIAANINREREKQECFKTQPGVASNPQLFVLTKKLQEYFPDETLSRTQTGLSNYLLDNFLSARPVATPARISVGNSVTSVLNPAGTHLPRPTPATSNTRPNLILNMYRLNVTVRQNYVSGYAGRGRMLLSASPGSITSTDGRIACNAANNLTLCSAQYSRAVDVTLRATPAPGYRFVSWSGANCQSTEQVCNVRVSANTTVEAFFTPGTGTPQPSPTVTVTPFPTTVATPNPTVLPTTAPTAIATATPTPTTGGGGGGGSGNASNLIFKSSARLTVPLFTTPGYIQNCKFSNEADCSAQVPLGQRIRFHAPAYAGSLRFNHIRCVGGTTSFTTNNLSDDFFVSEPTTCTVFYGDGAGGKELKITGTEFSGMPIVSSPSGISCNGGGGNGCKASFNTGQIVRLTFPEWIGFGSDSRKFSYFKCSGATTAQTGIKGQRIANVAMAEDTSCTAFYGTNGGTLLKLYGGQYSGLPITSSPAGLNCNFSNATQCEYRFDPGSRVRINFPQYISSSNSPGRIFCNYYCKGQNSAVSGRKGITTAELHMQQEWACTAYYYPYRC